MNASWSADSFPSMGEVSTEKALRLSAVFAAIRHIVDFGSTLPVQAFRTNQLTDQRTRMPLPQLLRREEGPGAYGAGNWIGQALFGLTTVGNAVGWIAETDGYGYPTYVRWLRNTFWSYNELTHQWYVLGEPVPADRIFHIPWIVPSGFTLGLSPIQHYAQLVGTGLSAQEYADIRRGGGVPPTVLRNSQRVIDRESAQRISDQASKSFASGKPFVTGNDWELDIPSIPPSHAQFIETSKLTALQIATIYGIDPREIGGEEGRGTLTYKTDESRALNRANDMRPYLERIESAVTRILPADQTIRMNVDETIRTDMATRTDIVGQQLADGRLSLNEARAMDDRTPVPGGDVHVLQQANQPVVLQKPAINDDTQ